MQQAVIRRGILPGAAAGLMLGLVATPAAGDGSVDLTDAGILPPLEGVCADFVSGATGMVTGGEGTIQDLDVPGEPLVTFVEWSGTEDESSTDPATATLDIAVDGAAPVAVTGDQLPDPAGSSDAPSDHTVYAWVADISDMVTTAGTYDFDLSGWEALPWFTEGAGSWGATITTVYESPGPCTNPSDIRWHGGVDVYFGGAGPGQEENWGGGAAGEGHVTDLFVFEVPASSEERVATVQFTAGGVAQARDGVCREANIWYSAGSGITPSPEDDLVTFEQWGEPIAPADPGGIEIVRQPFGYPGCEPTLNPVDRLTETNPDTGESWVAQEDGHPCADPAECPYRAVDVRPDSGGFVGRDWALSQVDVLIPPGATWLAFQLESPTDSLARTGFLEESGGWSGQILLRTTSPVGSLEVVKTLSGDVEGHGPGSTFPVEVDCTDDAFDTTLDLVPDEPQSITAIPAGTECSVTETSVPDPINGFSYGEPTYDPGQNVTITANEAVTVTVDNPLEREPNGVLQVAKSVTGAVDGYVDGSAFEITVDCTDDTFDTVMTLEDGQSDAISDIPFGTECAVTETSVADAANGFAYAEPIVTPVTVTLNEETPFVTVDVENPITQLTGALTITKKLSGATNGYVDGSTFEFDLDCTDDAFDDTFALTADASYTVSEIPVGTECTVAEVAVPAAADEYSYGPATYSPGETVAISSADEVVEATVTNPLTHEPPLPVTGAQIAGVAGLGGLLVLSGLVLMLARRGRAAGSYRR